MAAKIHFEIVSPAGVSRSGEVDMVVLPTTTGEIGVLPHHEPVMTMLEPGEMAVTHDGKTTYAALGEGFAQITPGRISILTDMVAGEGEIDEDAVAKAVERAQTALANAANLSDEEASALEAGLKRNLAMLGVKRRRRSA
ncbi:MAG: ATP synthase F1 subunit epsilon [Chthoniobacterales bacterium]|nr:ATP synthase F1 subunit epsilon [Chthoniobacterales bacterium]